MARLRELPSVDQVLKTPAGQAAAAEFGHGQAGAAVRAALALARRAVRQGSQPPDAEKLAE